MRPIIRTIIVSSLLLAFLMSFLASAPYRAQAEAIAYGGYISETKFDKETDVIFKGTILNTFTNQSIALKAFVVNFTEVLPEDANRDPRTIELNDTIAEEHQILDLNQAYTHTMKKKVPLGSGEYNVSIYFKWVTEAQKNNPAATINKAYSLINQTVEVIELPTSTKVLLYALGIIGGGILLYALYSLRKAVFR